VPPFGLSSKVCLFTILAVEVLRHYDVIFYYIRPILTFGPMQQRQRGDAWT